MPPTVPDDTYKEVTVQSHRRRRRHAAGLHFTDERKGLASSRSLATRRRAVGWFPTIGAEKFYGRRAFNASALRAYVKDHEVELRQPNHYLGGWPSPEDSRIYLDVSENVSTREQAHQLGVDRNQWGVHNLGPPESYEPEPANTLIGEQHVQTQ